MDTVNIVEKNNGIFVLCDLVTRYIFYCFPVTLFFLKHFLFPCDLVISTSPLGVNPLTAGAAYIQVFIFLLAH